MGSPDSSLFLLSISSMCRGSVAVSDRFYIQWKVAGGGYGKQYTIRTIRVNWDPWIQHLEDSALLSSSGHGYIFLSKNLAWVTPGSGDTSAASHHKWVNTRWQSHAWVWGKEWIWPSGADFVVLTPDTLINPCSISKWKFIYNQTYPEISLVYQASALLIKINKALVVSLEK